MKIRIHFFLFIILFTVLFAGCNDSKQTNTEAKENQPQSDKQASLNNNIDLQAPSLLIPQSGNTIIPTLHI